jgi:hypothetical protein
MEGATKSKEQGNLEAEDGKDPETRHKTKRKRKHPNKDGRERRRGKGREPPKKHHEVRTYSQPIS